MLALIFNAGWMELMLIAVIAVLVFGRDLPQVAAKAFVHLQRLRRGVQQVWRETGISQEMRNLSRQLEENDRNARAPLEKARRLQAELRDQVSRSTARAASPSDASDAEAPRDIAPRPVVGNPVPGTQPVEASPKVAGEPDPKDEPR